MGSNSQNGPKEQAKPSKTASFIAFWMLQIILHLSAIVPAYAILTLNLQLICTLSLIILLQLRMRKSQKFADFVSKYMHPAKAFNTFTFIDDSDNVQTKDQNLERCIYGFHPHAIYAMGFFCCFNNEADPAFCTIRGLASNFILNLPVLGAILRLWGIGSVSNSEIISYMQKGKSIALLPGGFEEATITSAKELRCWIKQRKGFIKYALKYDYAIRPVLIFQEHQGFWTFEPLLNFRLFLNRFKIPGVVFWNKMSGLMLPTGLDITVVKGRAVNPDRKGEVSQPTQELIDKTHNEYMQQIERIYSKYQKLNEGKPLVLY